MKKMLTLILCTVSVFAFAQFRGIGAAKTQQCASNLKQIGVGFSMYLVDHNQFPNKLEELPAISQGVLKCPQTNKKYIYLGRISGNNKHAIPCVIEAIGNHAGKINVLWQDGHVSALSHKATNYQGLLGYFKGLTQAQKAELLKALKKADAGK